MSYAPTATGSLQTTPFGHLLVYALDRQLTGTLVLEEQNGNKHAVLFNEGGPAKVKTAEPIVYLSQILIERGLVSQELSARTLDVALRDRRLHGEVLESEGAIDAAALKAALREQLMRQVLWMFKLPFATAYGYYDRMNFLERWGGGEGVRVPPLDLIWRGLREFAPAQEIETRLARLGSQPIKLHLEAPIQRFHFAPREHAVIDVLRAKPQPLGELLSRGLGSEAEIKRLVYGLLITRQLDSGIPGVTPVGVDEAPSSSRMSVAQRVFDLEQPAPRAASRFTPPRAPEPAAAAPEPPPVADSPEVAELRRELESLVKNEYLNHYQVLGVTAQSSSQAVQSAFFALAKKWHPDRLAPEFAAVRELATRVFARMTEANQVLTDPARRREYDEELKHAPTADEVEQVQRVLRATTAYQKAEVLLKRNNLAGAEAEAKIAIDNDPSQADHIAIYAWIQSLKPDGNFEDFLKTLDKAVHMEPNNLRVRWYRGQLLKRMDRGRRAVVDFRFIVEKDPRHLDAQREIRLYEMRRSNPSHPPSKRPSDPSKRPSDPSKPPSKPEGGGLFGKFFKKS